MQFVFFSCLHGRQKKTNDSASWLDLLFSFLFFLAVSPALCLWWSVHTHTHCTQNNLWNHFLLDFLAIIKYIRPSCPARCCDHLLTRQTRCVFPHFFFNGLCCFSQTSWLWSPVHPHPHTFKILFHAIVSQTHTLPHFPHSPHVWWSFLNLLWIFGRCCLEVFYFWFIRKITISEIFHSIKLKVFSLLLLPPFLKILFVESLIVINLF